MRHDEFKILLDEAGLSKKRFSELTGVTYSTVLGWGRDRDLKNGKKKLRMPNWVNSWIENYLLAQKYVRIKEAIGN